MSGPDDPDWNADTLRVPDDISSLDADVVAFRREQSARRRRQRLDRATAWARRLRWYGVSVPVVVAALLVVGGLGTLLVLLGPRTAPTAAGTGTGTPAALPGHPGGPILPVTLTRADGTRVQTGSLVGPAVVLLVPVGCDCDSTVAAVAAAATVAAVPSYVVSTAPQPAGSTVLTDPQGRLLATYGRIENAPTLLHLAAGVVDVVWTGMTADRAAQAVGAR